MKCGECPHQAVVPSSENIIGKHLRGGDARSGDFVAGVYPLLKDETCWFIAAGFDKDSGADGGRALFESCHGKKSAPPWSGEVREWWPCLDVFSGTFAFAGKGRQAI